jgi:NADPH2:quinone reductase
MADPRPGDGEVLVEVAAAAVNFSDTLVISGGYQVPVEVPFTPGSEFAGVVTEAGRGVDGLARGDRVSGSVLTGAFAELLIAPGSSLSPVPSGVDLRTAAAFGVAHATAYHSLRSVADLNRGEWVVVLGAGGGVGLAGVEIAHALGGRVLAAASTEDKLELARHKGAEASVNYETEDLKSRIRAVTGEGADVVLDPVGGHYSEPALRATRWGGRFVTVGYASGEIPRIPLNLVMLKGVAVLGFEIRNFMANAPELLRRDRRELADLLISGALTPHISAVYDLDDVVDALESVGGRHSVGKVLITPGKS